MKTPHTKALEKAKGGKKIPSLHGKMTADRVKDIDLMRENTRLQKKYPKSKI